MPPPDRVKGGLAGYDTGAARILADHIAMVHKDEAIVPLAPFPDLITPALQPNVTKAVAEVMPAPSSSQVDVAGIARRVAAEVARHFGDQVAAAIADADFTFSFGEHQFRPVVQDAQRRITQGQY